MFGFSRSFAITTMSYTYPNFLNKGNDPLRMQVSNCFGYLSIFVDVGENLIMANDVATPSNRPVAPVEHEKLVEAPLNVNDVAQRRTIQNSGAHSSQSFSMGSSIIS
jgi:hypothetical protein